MYDPPSKAPPTPSDIPAIMTSQYASALSLRNRQVCRQLNERFFHSPDKIERLVKELNEQHRPAH